MKCVRVTRAFFCAVLLEKVQFILQIIVAEDGLGLRKACMFAG